MKETLHPPPMPARPSQGRRFHLGPARIALLLVLHTAGLGLLVRTVLPDAPLAGTAEEGARAAQHNLPRDQVASPCRSLQEILAHPDIIPTHDHPLLGRPAPAFECADAQGKVWNLGELQNGGPVVLIFYYGYHCVACVRQLFEVNKDLPLFREAGARVVAISADPAELTRRRFQQYGPFGFPVLADPGNKVAQAYQVFRPALDGQKAVLFRHATFVIDREGKVGWVNVGDAPLRRNPALLYQLARRDGRLPSVGGTLP